MAEFQDSNSFTWGDALFLYIERPGQPLSMACVSVFEGKVPLKACRDFVESKLPLIPRYRQHVVFPPFNVGLPSWQFDPNFDIRNHIRQVTLRQGTENDLKRLASEIVSTHLDRQRPLWDLTLVGGLQGNRTGMIARIHHCLADGIAGVEIINVLMDPSPIPPPIPSKKAVFHDPPARDPGAALLDGLLNSYFTVVKGALTLHSEALKIAQEAFANPGGPLADLVKVLPELTSPAERLPFNVVCQGPQKFAWTEIPMAEIQAIRQNCGGTVNDVILTVVSAAIRRYAELRRVRVKGRSARIIIPVNVRGGESVSELGNRISFLPVTIPLDIRDPQKLFTFVRERMEYLKNARAAEFVGLAGGLFSTIPAAILAAVGPVASQLPLSLCNIICTNIRGPQVPVYLLGHKMVAWYPYVPIGGEMGINCAILSYNGTAYFGFTCDVNAVPDPGQLEKFVDQSFAELLRGSLAKPQARETAAEAAKQTRRSRTIPFNTPVAKPSPAKVPTKIKTKANSKLVRAETPAKSAAKGKFPATAKSKAKRVRRKKAVGGGSAVAAVPESRPPQPGPVAEKVEKPEAMEIGDAVGA